jgi:NADH-quinone oxidoreductase subunit G
MLSLSGMEYNSVTEVLAAALPGVASGQCVDSTRLSNFSAVATDLEDATDKPCTASIYQLDPLVRRAASLQLTADGRAALLSEEASA